MEEATDHGQKRLGTSCTPIGYASKRIKHGLSASELQISPIGRKPEMFAFEPGNQRREYFQFVHLNFHQQGVP